MNKAGSDQLKSQTRFPWPVEAQQKIAAVIDEAHKSCSELTDLAKQKLQSLDALRQSLLQKAFAGELT